MLADKWRTPITLAACSHVVLFILLISVLSEPAISKEAEYMEVTLAELFTPPEPANIKEKVFSENEYSRNTTLAPQNKLKNVAASTDPLVGQSTESTPEQDSVVGLEKTSRQPSGVPVTASKPIPGVSRGPRVVKSQEPVFSEEARKQGWQGTVRIRVVISEYGSVQEIQLAEGSGHSQLDESALACLRGWQFSPALKEGRPVPSRIVIPITFKLS